VSYNKLEKIYIKLLTKIIDVSPCSVGFPDGRNRIVIEGETIFF